jgi:putative Mg2+ transporter-C (MgtC) family protein
MGIDFSWDWQAVAVNLIRIGIAFVLAFPIGWDRSRSARSVGLRTFPLVAVASCGYVLLARNAPDSSAESIARIVQGLIAGIGFLGGGAILKDKSNVYGLATAASIWNTAAVGAAVAYEREEIAVVLAVINLALLRLLTPITPLDDYVDPGGSADPAARSNLPED